MGEMNIGPYLMLYVRSSLKYIIDLNIKTKTINLLKEIRGKILINLGLGKEFLDMIPKSQSIIEKIEIGLH